MNKQFYYLLLCWSILLINNGNAQQIIANSGTTYQNSSLSISFTLGELVIDTRSVSSLTITQGFHQTKITITAVNELSNSNCTISAYPNPTSDWVKLTIEKSTIKDIEYALYDLNGKLLTTKKMGFDEVQIPFTTLPASIYFLKVIIGGKEVKTFKIVKQ